VLQLFPQCAYSRSEDENIRYVSDVLKINIKDRLEKPYEVVTTVQSDDAVRILEENGDYLKIETADGKQGWIAKHYLKSGYPKNLLIKQLNQEIADLKDKLAHTSPAVSDTNSDGKTSGSITCSEIQQKLNEAEKFITQQQEEIKNLQNHPSSSPPMAPAGSEESPIATDQLEQTPENYALLVSEYEKRGKKIDELQQIVGKKEDQSRFLWFGAGAIVFLIGLLAGKTGNRKKNKLMY
jgi:uncharacterized protein YgiM (DUF1202 family)